MIVVLINETVKKYLLKQSQESRKKIREKFEFLETGIWDGGLKVKKLKGVSSKYVFEARLDKAKRILFTLGRGESSLPVPNLMVYVWGIAAHDDVSKKSKNIIPANAPFLQFGNYDEILLDNIDMEELEHPYFTQETITQKIHDESGSQKWFAVDEPEWQRIRLYTRDDFELFLYLTPEQEEVLATPLPLMVSGTAGSGKTTLSVYYLLNRHFNKKKKLFITYNYHLKNYAQKLYNGLLNQREWKDDVIIPDFYTYKELCLELAGKKRYPPENEVDFDRFTRFFSAYPGHQSFDPILVWEEIRGILKGAVSRVNFSILENAKEALQKGSIKPGMVRELQAQFLLFSRLESLQAVDRLVNKYLQTNIRTFATRMEKFLNTDSPREKDALVSLLDRTVSTLKKQGQNTGSKYLSYFEYESLGKKKAPNFQGNRKEIYHIFEWYQTKLEKEKLWDELDLVPDGVESSSVYDILVCDEIQDFTDTQLDLLFKLVANPNNMFLAGDIRQTINPSGFRWEEVRRHFYERGFTVPGLKMLTLNFRSSGSIVELSNILLEMKEKLTGKKADEVREEWKYKGRPVTVVSSIPRQDMLEILKEAGARRTILVRSETEKETLKKHLDTELVFTIKEAKGLEFDTVVLWTFCDDQTTADVWKVILDLSTRNIHEAKIKHEINLLYVGITRSQKDLIIYDGPEPSLIWKSDRIKNSVYITDDRTFIEGTWNVVSTPEEWIEQGNYFFERGYYRAAAECYKNGGDEMGLARARAYYYEKTGSYKDAAVNFEKLKEIEKAARYYEMAREFKKALPLWEKLRNHERALLCRAEFLQEEGNFQEAGQLFLEKKKYQEAVACFQQAKDYRQLADIYHKSLKNLREAARCYELDRDFETAAALYVRLKSYDNAAHLYEQTKNYANAEKYWKKAKNTKRLLDLYQKSGQNDKLFLLYEKQKEPDKALKFLKAQNLGKEYLLKEAKALYRKKRYFNALLRFQAAGESKGIGDCYLQMKKYREAIPHFEAAGALYSAGQAYQKVKEYKKALVSFLDSAEDKEKHYAKARSVVRKNWDWRFKRAMALDYYNKKDYERAGVIFSGFGGFWMEKGICHAIQGDKGKAFVQWERCRMSDEYDRVALECIDKNLVEIGAEFFLAIKDHIPPHLLLFVPGIDPAIKMSPPARLMDIYLQNNPDTRDMSNWGEYIARWDFPGRYWETVLAYLEKARQYNVLVPYFKRYEIHSEDQVREVKARFAQEIPGLQATGPGGLEALAFRYIILEKYRELNRLLEEIPLAHHNFYLYLWGERDFRQQAFDYCVRHQLSKILIEGEMMTRRDNLLGEFYEYAGDFPLAAKQYKFSLNYRKAAELYQKTGNYNAAGDCYFELRDYRSALDMFEKGTPPDSRKLAGTYEKLKDFEHALIYWEKARDRKGVDRCIKKLEKLEKNKQRKLPLFDT